jgi:hypothetical protein
MVLQLNVSAHSEGNGLSSEHGGPGSTATKPSRPQGGRPALQACHGLPIILIRSWFGIQLFEQSRQS